MSLVTLRSIVAELSKKENRVIAVVNDLARVHIILDGSTHYSEWSGGAWEVWPG